MTKLTKIALIAVTFVLSASSVRAELIGPDCRHLSQYELGAHVHCGGPAP